MAKRGVTVPIFGAWGDHGDFETPYSMIFESARKERSEKQHEPLPELGHGQKCMNSKEGNNPGSRFAHFDQYKERKTSTHSSPQRVWGEGHARNEGKEGRMEKWGRSSLSRPLGGPFHPSAANAPLPSSLEENWNGPPLRNSGGLDFPGIGICRSAPVGDRKLPPESPDNKGLAGAVPKFGEWNRDPSVADGYTGVFEKARRQKKKDVIAPNMQLESPVNMGRYENTHKHPESSHIRNCFPEMPVEIYSFGNYKACLLLGHYCGIWLQSFACCFASSGAQ